LKNGSPDPAIYLHAPAAMGFLPKNVLVMRRFYKGARCKPPLGI